MLKNMRVGTKLVGLLIAPLLVLGILAGVGVADRLERARDARRAERLAEVVAQTASTAHQLQLEQLRAAVVVGAEGDAGVDTFVAQQAVTDEALEALRASLEPFTGAAGPLADRADTLADRVQGLSGLRQGVVDVTLPVQDALDGYEVVVDAATGLLEATSDEPSLPAITQELMAANTLSRSKAAAAQRGAILTAGLASGNLDRTVLDAAQSAQDEATRRSDTFFEQASRDVSALLRNTQSSAEASDLDVRTEAILDPEDDGLVPEVGGAVGYADLNAVVLSGTLGVENEIARSTFLVASEERRSAITTVRLYLAGAILGLVAALAVGFLVARAITRPLRQLTAAADQLATDQLPSLVERLRSPDETDPDVELVPLAIGGRDEIGQLAQAFNTVQETTAQVAADQSILLRKGVSDLFVNLARRNQALLDRQIEFIDQLEANETDADQLENLFRLDHLATRMRRNAESLLVLAGAEGPRRRGRPVPLADVVRIAVGEVEDFTRINLLSLDEVSVDAAGAVDLAHMLAELMENATQFSPPETRVEVVGHRTRDGGYVVSVSDQGIGMSPDHLVEVNEQLANPPVMGLALSRALGFTVVGRLAARHGLRVRVTSSPTGGVTALTSIPPELLVEEAPATARPGGAARPVEAPARPAVPALVGAPGPAQPNGWSANGFDEATLPTRNGVNGVNGTARPASNGAGAIAAPADFGQSFTYYDVGEDDAAPRPFGRPPGASAPPPPSVARPQQAARPAPPPPPARPAQPPRGVQPARPAQPPRAVQPARPAQPERPATPGPTTSRGPAPPAQLPRRAVPVGRGDRPGDEPAEGSADARPTAVDRRQARPTDPRRPARPPAPAGAEARPVPEPRPERRPSLRGLDSDGPIEAGRGDLTGADLPSADLTSAELPSADLTSAGLVRRSPKQQLRDLGDDGSGDAGRPAAASSQRSPEEVRQMLSRYRTGLQRGRSTQPPPAPGGHGGQDLTGEEPT